MNALRISFTIISPDFETKKPDWRINFLSPSSRDVWLIFQRLGRGAPQARFRWTPTFYLAFFLALLFKICDVTRQKGTTASPFPTWPGLEIAHLLFHSGRISIFQQAARFTDITKIDK